MHHTEVGVSLIHGGVQETFRCCTEGCGLVGNTGDRRTVGLDDLRGLSNLYDSVILCVAAISHGRHSSPGSYGKLQQTFYCEKSLL